MGYDPYSREGAVERLAERASKRRAPPSEDVRKLKGKGRTADLDGAGGYDGGAVGRGWAASSEPLELG